MSHSEAATGKGGLKPEATVRTQEDKRIRAPGQDAEIRIRASLPR